MKSLPTIVLIHALNPYGFATGRRVNEENIDINRLFYHLSSIIHELNISHLISYIFLDRNFLSPELWKEVLSRHPNFAGI